MTQYRILRNLLGMYKIQQFDGTGYWVDYMGIKNPTINPGLSVLYFESESNARAYVSKLRREAEDSHKKSTWEVIE